PRRRPRHLRRTPDSQRPGQPAPAQGRAGDAALGAALRPARHDRQRAVPARGPSGCAGAGGGAGLALSGGDGEPRPHAPAWALARAAGCRHSAGTDRSCANRGLVAPPQGPHFREYRVGRMKPDKRASMREAVAEYVTDGISVAIEGFTAFICFAAGHEIIRQGRRDLTLIRMTPDALYDQMVAAAVARKLVFSYLGTPGVGPLHCIRRAVEQGVPNRLELEEYSQGGMIARYQAAATGLPFLPLHSYVGTDLPRANPDIRFLEDPY